MATKTSHRRQARRLKAKEVRALSALTSAMPAELASIVNVKVEVSR